MMKLHSLFWAGLLVAGCSAESELNSEFAQHFPEDVSAEPGEVFKPYNNIPILFKEEMAGDQPCLVQQIEYQREDVIFRMKKIPTELYVQKELQHAPQDVIDSAVADLKGEQVFYFELEESERKDLLKKYHDADYEQAVSYLSFDILNDFQILTESGDTLVPNFTLYERNFHLAPFERVLIDFTGLQEGESFELVYRDNLFGKGELRFSFPDQKFIDANIKDIL
ncbi:MAG: hypothetical protein HYZ14_02445 [Bacteroidetes bacterium]|nr:hypothetical protein [Bacteroidota bacterium]